MDIEMVVLTDGRTPLIPVEQKAGGLRQIREMGEGAGVHATGTLLPAAEREAEPTLTVPTQQEMIATKDEETTLDQQRAHGADGTVKIWSTPTADAAPKLLSTLYGHLAGISTLAFSADGRMLASGSDDKIIRLWAVPSGTPYPIPLAGHHNYIYSIAFSPKGNMLVSGSYDEAVFLWDVRSARIMKTLPAHSDPVSGVDFNRDGTLLASCSTDGLIRIWDTITGQCLRTLVHEDRKGVTSVRFSPNSLYVVAWTLDQRIRLWDYTQGKCVKTYQGHQNKLYSLTGAVSAYEKGTDEAFLVSGSEDGSIWVWDVESKNALWTSGPGAHTDTIFGVDITRTSTDGDILMVSAGMDHKIRLWKCIVAKGTRTPINVDGPINDNEPGATLNGLVNGTAVNESSDEEDEDDDSDADDSDHSSTTTKERIPQNSTSNGQLSQTGDDVEKDLPDTHEEVKDHPMADDENENETENAGDEVMQLVEEAL